MKRCSTDYIIGEGELEPQYCERLLGCLSVHLVKMLKFCTVDICSLLYVCYTYSPQKNLKKNTWQITFLTYQIGINSSLTTCSVDKITKIGTLIQCWEERKMCNPIEWNLITFNNIPFDLTVSHLVVYSKCTPTK